MAGSIVPTQSAAMFFWSRLSDQGVGLTDEAMAYVVGVLVAFTRADRAYAGVNHGENVVLVDFLVRATEADPAERLRIYRHVGDVAMFTAGLFAEGLVVGRRYYVSIGEGAYGSAAALSRPVAAVVMEELADRFEDVTDALTESLSVC
jgi:hypothetical protein